MKNEEGGDENSNVNYFEMLPEGCIADAVSHTSPVDACRLSLVASSFRAAADSDVVWDRFLPSDYQDLVARSVDYADAADDDHRDSCPNKKKKLPLSFNSKKELYLYLCDHPLIIDAGAMSFSLDKLSGKKCLMIAARELSIVWADTPRYWRWTSLSESRFAEVAELLCVCWLEIHGKVNTCILSPDTTYTIHLVFKQTVSVYGFEHQPVEVSVKVDGGESTAKTVYLDPEGGQRHRNLHAARQIGRSLHLIANRPRPQVTVPIETNSAQYPKSRVDGWLEIEMGEFFNGKGENNELQMSLLEVKGGHWKSGLIVQGIEIRPKSGK